MHIVWAQFLYLSLKQFNNAFLILIASGGIHYSNLKRTKRKRLQIKKKYIFLISSYIMVIRFDTKKYKLKKNFKEFWNYNTNSHFDRKYAYFCWLYRNPYTRAYIAIFELNFLSGNLKHRLLVLVAYRRTQQPNRIESVTANIASTDRACECVKYKFDTILPNNVHKTQRIQYEPGVC